MKNNGNGSKICSPAKPVTSSELSLSHYVQSVYDGVELWKTVPGFPWYQASNMGRIRSINPMQRGRKQEELILRPAAFTGNRVKRKNYRLVKLYAKALTPKTLMWHRVIIMTFDRPPKKNERVIFVDNNPKNTRLTNLMIVTCKQQTEKARSFLIPNAACKLDHNKAAEIRRRGPNYKFVLEEFKKAGIAVKAIGVKLGVDTSTIRHRLRTSLTRKDVERLEYLGRSKFIAAVREVKALWPMKRTYDEISTDYNEARDTVNQIAREYKIDYSTVLRVLNGVGWQR